MREDLECVDHLLRPLTQPFIAKNYKETETIYASFLPYSSGLEALLSPAILDLAVTSSKVVPAAIIEWLVTGK